MSKKIDFGVFNSLINKAKSQNSKRIVLPESGDYRIIEAGCMAIENGVCNITFLGKEENILPKLSKLAKPRIEIIDPSKESKVKTYYAEKLYELRKHKGMTPEKAKELLSDKIYFGTMMVQNGDADGMVAGAITHTADILRPAFQIVKTKPNISKASSCFILEMPKGSAYGENGFMVLADCAVNIDPTAEELADIAISSAETAKKICGMKPKVALLSYSTKADEDNKELPADIIKVKDAYKEVRRKASSLAVEGEIQVDAAIEPFVASIKCPKSKIAGKANVLIFPDLNSGNIAYKLASKLGKLYAVGPLIQGLNKPINDLSRSATTNEIYLTIALTVLQ